MINPDIERKVLNILEEEVVPAQGCTEPIAIAFTAAKAREILGDTVERVVIKVSGNMIKNVKSVVVPNSGGLVGIETSAAMGIVAGHSRRDLMVISDITSEEMVLVNAFSMQLYGSDSRRDRCKTLCQSNGLC